MSVLEIVAIALKFLLLEFPKLLEKYKNYRLDKEYKNKELAYEEAMREYLKGKIDNDRLARITALRKLGKNKKR